MKDKEKNKDKEKAKLKKAPPVDKKSKRLKKVSEDEDDEEAVELDIEDDEDEEDVEDEDDDAEIDALDDEDDEEEPGAKAKPGKAGKASAPKGKPGKRAIIDLEDVEPDLEPDEQIGELEDDIIIIPKPRGKRGLAALEAVIKSGEDPSKPQTRLGLIRARHEAIRREIDQIREDLESDEEE